MRAIVFVTFALLWVLLLCAPDIEVKLTDGTSLHFKGWAKRGKP